MPGPQPPPSHDAQHDRHDALLVAQLSSGDPLEAAQRQEAERLVATCPACASLASDLRTLARAVAWEPLPPRRRDFRLASDEASRLRGSALSRLLRRIPLPQPGALRPAAVGALSIGLLFVVAGNMWPDHAAVTAPAVAPSGVSDAAAASMSAVAPIDQQVPVVELAPADEATGVLQDIAAPDELDGRLENDLPADAAGVAAEGDDSAAGAALEEPAVASEELEAAGVEPAAPADALAERAAQRETQAETQPKATEGVRAFEMAAEAFAEPSPGLGATTTDGTAFRDASDSVGMAGKDEALKSDTEDATVIQSPAPLAALASSAPVVAAETAVLQAPAESAVPAAPLGAAVDGDATTVGEPASPQAETRTTIETDDGIGIQSILVAVGTVLAIGGAVLLMLTWFLRRSADPLLR